MKKTTLTYLGIIALQTFFPIAHAMAQSYNDYLRSMHFLGGDITNGIGYGEEFTHPNGTYYPEVGYKPFKQQFLDLLAEAVDEETFNKFNLVSAWVSVDYFTGSNDHLLNRLEKKEFDFNEEYKHLENRKKTMAARAIASKNGARAMKFLLLRSKRFGQLFYETLHTSLYKNPYKRQYFFVPPTPAVHQYIKEFAKGYAAGALYHGNKGKITDRLEQILLMANKLKRDHYPNLVVVDLNDYILYKPDGSYDIQFTDHESGQTRLIADWEIVESEGRFATFDLSFSKDFQYFLANVLLEKMSKYEEISLRPAP